MSQVSIPVSDVVCFGEIMLRLTPPDQLRLADAPSLQVHFGGAEANVAVQLAHLGRSAGFVSRLPENPMADRCIEALRARGVQTAGIQRGGSRMGLYFLECGADPRPSVVTYDRANSAITEMMPGMFDWNALLAGARWFHWSGITPALGKGGVAVCEEAIIAAHRNGVPVSFDVNFRSSLWSRDTAARILQPLLPLVDVCVTGENEAISIMGASPANGSEEERQTQIGRNLVERFGFNAVAMTSRTRGSSGLTAWRGMLMTGGAVHHSRTYEISVVDRVGAGDSFTGALIYALLRGDGPTQTIEFATAASALKHTVFGDWARSSLKEVEELASGDSSLHIRR